MKTDQLTEHLSKAIEVMKTIKDMNLEENRLIDEFLKNLIDDIDKANEQDKDKGKEGDGKGKGKKGEPAKGEKSADPLRKMLQEAIVQQADEAKSSAVMKNIQAQIQKAVSKQKDQEEGEPEEAIEVEMSYEPQTKDSPTTVDDSVNMKGMEKVWCAVCEEYHGIGKNGETIHEADNSRNEDFSSPF